MLIQNFFSAVSYGVIDPDSAKEKARVKQQEDNRRLGFPDRPVHGLPPRIPVGLDLVDAEDARSAHSPVTAAQCVYQPTSQLSFNCMFDSTRRSLVDLRMCGAGCLLAQMTCTGLFASVYLGSHKALGSNLLYHVLWQRGLSL